MTLGEPPITCRYTITQNDYAVLNAALMHVPSKRTALMYVRLGIFAVMVFVIVFLLKQVTGDSWSEIALGMGPGILIGSVLIYLFRHQLKRLYGKWMARAYYKSDLVVKDERELTFSDDGLFVDSAKFKGNSPWSAFISIMRSEYHFIIWQNSRQAHVVPFRAFKDGDVERLWQFLEAMPPSKRVRLK